MKTSRSESIPIRGLNYHCRIWGEPSSPKLFMLHGFQDESASWQFTVDAFQEDWYVIAPDWRGYGLSEWSKSDAYWMPDFVGDLDFLIEHFAPDEPVRIVAHSMGAGIAAIYAGARPERVSHFINVDGFGPSGARQDPPARRIAKWLRQLRDDSEQRPYQDFEEFALRMQSENPRLSHERARFIVQHWGMTDADGSVVRRADPAHKRINPLPFSTEEMLAVWQQTEAAVLWIAGAQSGLMERLYGIPGEFELRSAAYEDLQIEHIEDSGHNVHHDQPEQLAEMIEKFLPRHGTHFDT